MSERGRFKVHVEASRCQGHSRCHSIAPELFESDDYGNSRARGDGTVAPELEDKARLAVRNCPEHAVRMTKTD
jgi:ferredoxin